MLSDFWVCGFTHVSLKNHRQHFLNLYTLLGSKPYLKCLSRSSDLRSFYLFCPPWVSCLLWRNELFLSGSLSKVSLLVVEMLFGSIVRIPYSLTSSVCCESLPELPSEFHLASPL